MPDFNFDYITNVNAPIQPGGSVPEGIGEDALILPPPSFDAFNKLITDFTEFMTVDGTLNDDTTLVNFTYRPNKRLNIVSPSMLISRHRDDTDPELEAPLPPWKAQDIPALDGHAHLETHFEYTVALSSIEGALEQDAAAQIKYEEDLKLYNIKTGNIPTLPDPPVLIDEFLENSSPEQADNTAFYNQEVTAEYMQGVADYNETNGAKIISEFERTKTILVEHEAGWTFDTEMGLLGDVQFFLGIQHKKNGDLYRPAHLYIIEIAEITPVTPRLTRIRFIGDIEPEPDDIHIVDARVVDASLTRTEILHRALVGRQARIHVAPSDAIQVMNASSSAVRVGTDVLEGIEFGYSWTNDRLTERDKITMASVGCCLIQVLGAYEAANKRDDLNEFLDKKTAQLDDIILGLEILISVNMAAQRASMAKLLEMIVNIGAMIHNAAMMALTMTAFHVTKGVILGVLYNLRNRYFKALDDAQKREDSKGAAALAALRCFGLDKMIIQLASLALDTTKKQITRFMKWSLYRKFKKAKLLGVNPEDTQSNVDFLQHTELLTSIRDVIWAIKQAVNAGELCFNRGYTDIPLVVKDSTGDLGPDVLPVYPLDTQERDSLAEQLGLGSGENPGTAAQADDYLNSLFTEGESSSNNTTGAPNVGTGAYSGGILAPTEEEMAQFLEKYLKLSRTDAIATVMSNRDTPCKDKLSSSQAGYLGSILSQAGLEL